MINSKDPRWVKLSIILFLFPILALGETSIEKAQLLYSRIAGLKLSYASPVLARVSDLINQRKFTEAADVALNSDDFYNVSLFQYFAPLSNRSEASDLALNDMIAMGIANTFVDPVTKKDRPYTELVKGDFTVKLNGVDLPLENNNTLKAAFDSRLVLTPTNLKISVPQRKDFPDAAGVITSRQFMSEHAIGGTNRRIVHYAFREFLCTDIKEWRDGDNVSLTDEFVSRDVTRAPGGGPTGQQQYRSECRSCHQVQDGLRNAFAYHDFDAVNGKPIYIPGLVADKINKNIEFPAGFVVTTDAWENKADRNANSKRFDWAGPMTGRGAREFGEMIAKSGRFTTCAVERVWKHVCGRDFLPEEASIKEKLAKDFQSDDYSLRGLFKGVAVNPSCLGLGE